MYKFALIGCGRIAARHATNMVLHGRLIAVCDIDKNKADAFAEQYGAKAYYNIDDLLAAEKEVEVVAVCTPNGYHAEHAIKSLQKGKHVLCEKPMCITGAAAWQLIETEKFFRKKLFVVKSARYNPLLQQVHRLITNGSLGKVYSFSLSLFWNRPPEYYNDWRGKTFPDGGTLYTQFSHYIDAVLWLFGPLKSVEGFAANKAHEHSIEFEDTGVAAVQTGSGVLGTINWSVNTYKKNTEIALTVIAERGTIGLGGEYLNEVRYQQSETSIEVPAATVSNDYQFYKGSMSHHDEVYKNLVEALKNPAHPFTSAFEGLQTVEAIEKIYKAVNPYLKN